jgi:hypothetical protein
MDFEQFRIQGMTNQPINSPQFFLTAPSPCPYLEGQSERKVFTHLVGEKAPEFNDLLTQGGFRRSQNIAYRPACETCRACVSVRILARRIQTDPLDAPQHVRQQRPDCDRVSRRTVKRTVPAVSALSRQPPPERRHGRYEHRRLCHDGRRFSCRHRIIEYRVRTEGDGLQEHPTGELLAWR